ncbi:DUF3017 domain-containing protein [Ornithinimicrobium tianjinense]|uniref:DUF3017 domain-containing protein n=1 Tax=Ornithinimicrobium tianjinense TaxID=1195761 RepID=A0A917BP80_9MICO|nr:DUF3017 domain-containing protein [Ornithinimicrobium tianjinense]GGF51548.1 hypothetical protein GCM10011366_19270 [Ornithinimicrobium tianjinense]
MTAPGDDPEAEVRAAAPRQPLGLWWLAVIGLALAGLLLVTSNLRAYGYAVGVTLAVLALLRATLPEPALGGLVVRQRWTDVATLSFLGSAVAILASTLRLTDL